MDRRSAQRARRDREIESEWNCAQLHFWRREGEAEVQARPAQAHVHPTTAQWAQTTVHSAQSTGSTAAAASWEAQGRAAAIHPWPMPCKPCACVIIVQQITSFVSEVADAGAQVAGVSNSAIASNFSETLRHCTARTALLLAAALLSLLRSRCWMYTGRPEADAGM